MFQECWHVTAALPLLYMKNLCSKSTGPAVKLKQLHSYQCFKSREIDSRVDWKWAKTTFVNFEISPGIFFTTTRCWFRIYNKNLTSMQKTIGNFNFVVYKISTNHKNSEKKARQNIVMWVLPSDAPRCLNECKRNYCNPMSKSRENIQNMSKNGYISICSILACFWTFSQLPGIRFR